MIGKLFLVGMVALLTAICHISTASADSRPRVLVLATGGTIAGSAPSPSEVINYQAGAIGVGELLEAVPQLCDVADVKGEQLCNIDSKDMTDAIWWRLVTRVNEILATDEADGVVITHGTDTMEETAFFLSLTVNSEKPVVLTGAMRPATARNADGPRNLLDAVRVAASPDAKGRDVLVVMNGEIHAASEVTKTHTTSVAAFVSPGAGPLGRVDGSGAVFERAPLTKKRLHFSVEMPLPRVDILYGYEGDEGALVDAVLHAGAQGIVYAGLGNGSIPAEAEKQLTKASASDVIVVRSSRVNGGAVVSAGSTDFLDSGPLNPQKARVLLRLALTKTSDKEEIRQLFRE